MKVCFVCLLVIFCLHELHAACTSWNSSNRNHSKCYKSRRTTVKSHRTFVKHNRTTVKSRSRAPATSGQEVSSVSRPTTSGQEVGSVSTAVPCTVTWTEFDNVLTTIAPHLAFEIKGIEDCKAACMLKIPGCTAIDVYPNTTICAYHLRPITELTENRFSALQAGYKQLLLKRVCSSGSKMIKTETGNGNVSESCTRQWKITRDVHSAGYHTHLGVYGEEACKKDCMENIPGCVGIEVAKQVDSCNYFIQSIEELMKTRVPQEGNTQYILTPECHPIETSSSEIEPPTEQPYTISSLAYTATASKSCTANWTEVPDVISLLLSRRHITTDGREACQKACFETIPDCVGISAPAVDHIGTECIYYVEPLSQVVRSRIPFKGYTQFLLTRECSLDLMSTVTNEIALQEDPTIISSGRPIDVTTPTVECIPVDQWEEHKDVYSSGGALYSKALGIDACKTACVNDIADCRAVDYHATPFCWYHTKRRDFASRRQNYTGKGFIQHVRVCSKE